MSSHRLLALVCSLMSSAVLPSAPAFAQADPPRVEASGQLLRQPTDGILGPVAGVAVSTKSRVIYVLTHWSILGLQQATASSQLLVYNLETKDYIGQIAANRRYMVHGAAVRVDGNDAVWVVDAGANMVAKLGRRGEELLVVGMRAPEVFRPPWSPTQPARHTRGLFAGPTDIAWDSKGNIFVTDGVINSRLVRLNGDGSWYKEVGRAGAGDGEFAFPHGIAVDDADQIYVADANNARIQVFDTELNHKRTISLAVTIDPRLRPIIGDGTSLGEPKMLPNAPWALCIPPKSDELFVAVANPGRVYVVSIASGLVTGMVDDFQPSDTPGKRASLGLIHSMACPAPGVLVVAETHRPRVAVLQLHGRGDSPSRRP